MKGRLLKWLVISASLPSPPFVGDKWAWSLDKWAWSLSVHLSFLFLVGCERIDSSCSSSSSGLPKTVLVLASSTSLEIFSLGQNITVDHLT